MAVAVDPEVAEAEEEEDKFFFLRILLESLYKVIHGHWDDVLLQEKEVVLELPYPQSASSVHA